MEITRREIIASISIILLMIILGLVCSNRLIESKMDRDEKYNKALKISDKELFEYAMSTNVGNAFIYGNLETIDPVEYDDIDGQYLYLKRVKEVYTKHTRTVTYTDSNGKTKTKEETYWTWDHAGTDSLVSTKIKFLDIEFNASQFIIPEGEHIDTVKHGMNVRYKYYGVPYKFNCTIFSYLSNNNISQKTPIYYNKTIQETIEYLQSNVVIIMFWISWIILTIIFVYGFYYLDNNWLNS